MTYLTTFLVKPRMGFGRSSFPFDMLRYDACYPTGQADVAKMDSNDDPRFTKEMGDNPKVRLNHIGTERFWKPTTGRWESFGREVLDEGMESVRL